MRVHVVGALLAMSLGACDSVWRLDHVEALAPPTTCWSDTPTLVDVAEPNTVGQRAPAIENNLVWYTLMWDSQYDFDLAVATNASGTWSRIIPDNVNTFGREEDPFLDELDVMWFSASPQGSTTEQIFEAQTSGVSFEPQQVHAELGSRSGGSMTPALTRDSLTIYFTTNGTTISRASRDAVSSPFAAPEPLVAGHDIESPSIAADGATLYFSDHSIAPNAFGSRIASGRIEGTEIVDIVLVGQFQTGDEVSYADPHISRDGTVLAFTISQAGTSQLAYVRSCL